MSREAPRWNPAHWKWEHTRRTRSHAIDAAREALLYILGPYHGALACAALLRDLDEASSAAELKARNIHTLGEV